MPALISSSASMHPAGALAQLQALQERFEDKLQDWQDGLKQARERYPKLSFVYSQQFWLLSDFILEKSLGSALACVLQ